jgi:zinc protease
VSRLVLILLGCAAAMWAQAPAADRLGLKFGAPATVPMPPVAAHQLSNGIRVLLSENGLLPFINGIVILPSGTVEDPDDQIGLGEVTLRSLLTGGTRKRSAEQVRQDLGRWGAKVEQSVHHAHSEIRFSCPSEYLEPMLDLLEELLREPGFPVEAMEQAQALLRMQIGTLYQNPESASFAVLQAALRAQGRVSRRRMEFAHVDSIQREHLQARHARMTGSRAMLLALHGGFAAAPVREGLEKRFGSWKTTPEVERVRPESGEPLKALLLANLPQAGMAYVRLGMPAPPMTHPDYPAFLLLTSLWSQHMNRCLKADASIAPENLAPQTVLNVDAAGYGSLHIGGAVRDVAAPRVAQSLISAARTFSAAAVTEEQLDSARRLVLLDLANTLNRSDKVVQEAARLHFHGLAMNALPERNRQLMGLSKAALVETARKLQISERISAVVAADERSFLDSLDGAGLPVEHADLSIPPPPPLEPKTDAVSLAEGGKWLAKMKQALGGEQRLASIRDFSHRLAGIRYLPSGAEKLSYLDRWVEPNTFRQDQQAPGREVSVFYNGKVGWVAIRGRSLPLAPALLEQIRGEAFRLLFRLALSDKLADHTVSYIGSGILHIAGPEDNWVRVYLDEESGLPTRIAYRWVRSGPAPVPVEETYSDWKVVDGLRVPGRVITRQNSVLFSDFEVVEARLNSGIGKAELEKRP